MAKTFHLTIARVGENLFEGDVFSASFPGKEGVFEVLAEHEAFVTELKEGVVRVTTAENEKQEFTVVGGVVEVSNNQTTVLL